MIRLHHPCPAATPTDRFGWRAAIPGVIGAQLHAGQDYAAPTGTPIHAAHAGRVNRVWEDRFADGSPAGGLMVQIGAAQCTTRYAHLSASAVELGAEARAGQIIGYVGSTGAATGPHLHFELWIGGSPVDPVPYLTATPPQIGDDMSFTDDDRRMLREVHATLTPGQAGVKGQGELHRLATSAARSGEALVAAITPGVEGSRMPGIIVKLLAEIQTALTKLATR